MAFNPTKEQQLAMTEKGNVLVSAAAGSGKTAVLVERVISMLNDENNPIDANKLLIVTFTNAAAAEMRSRIEKRLGEESAKNPQNIRLLKQKHLIPSAKICTIDSFCIDLIRENFEKCGVSPDFEIGDESLVAPLSEQIFTEMIDEYLTQNEDSFKDLLDITDCEFDEKNFIETVEKIFLYSRQMPFPEEFLDGLSENYKVPFNSNHQWFSFAMKRAQNVIKESINSVLIAFQLSKDSGFEEKYLPMLNLMAENLDNIKIAVSKEDWDQTFTAINNYSRGTAPRIKGGNEIPEIIAIKEIYSQIDDEIDSLKNLFYTDCISIQNQIKRLKEPVLLLIKFTKEYAERLFQLQNKENKFTFYNTEQLAFSMLCENKNGQISVREEAQPIIDRYEEVLVDEYQDTNDLQDMLFKIISDRENKLFIVGDVKQSIYSFRCTNPMNFLNKKNRATTPDESEEGIPKKIILSKNFRSRKGICDYVNFFFKQMMNEKTGNLIYNKEEELVPGAEFPESDIPETDLILVDNLKSDNADNCDHLIFEARAVAKYIKEVVNGKECLKNDSNTLRKAKYSDFAILMRNTAGKSAVLAEELRNQGIPVSFSKESFTDSVEVSTFVCLLDIIDNPDNDISLLTVMMSPVFGFSAEEMALIRADKKHGSLISAVISAKEQGNEHAAEFLGKISYYRRESVVLPLPKFISQLLDMTNSLNIVSAMKDGKRKKANLQLLINYAADFSKNYSSGLGGFLRYIHSIKDKDLPSAKIGGGEESVKIMSMHSSKGLQFPICIIVNTVTLIHNRNSYNNYLFNENYGLGFKYYEESEKQKVDTLGYEVILSNQKQLRLEEELRLLYVAMTRAEERLVMVTSDTSFEKRLSSISARLLTCDCKINGSVFSSASGMSDWILTASLLHPQADLLRKMGKIPLIPIDTESRLNVTVYNAEALNTTVINSLESDSDTSILGGEYLQKIQNNISYSYPYESLIGVEAKTTVSLIANRAESEKFAFTALPAFMQKDGISPTNRGTATHKVMQFINFSDSINVDSEIERLVEWQFITESDAEAVNRKSIKRFFESELFNRIKTAETVKREMRFLTEMKAEKIAPQLPENLKNEIILVQGAVDLCFIEDGGLVIVDFKTDRVKYPNQLKDAYSEQLNIYAAACKKIFECEIKEKILYSFELNEEIQV